MPPGRHIWLRRNEKAAFLGTERPLSVYLSQRMLNDHLTESYGIGLREAIKKVHSKVKF